MSGPAVALGRYVVISPVKDEERHVETTIASMVRQTIRPDAWVIVDDGSSDRTPEILERCAREHSWIRLVRRDRNTPRQPGPAVIHSFVAGYNTVRNLPHDFVVKLDADLQLPETYFEDLLRRFAADERLGIASGVYLEDRGGRWQAVTMPAYHAAGASKMMRAECFRQIGGFVPVQGWDTIDEIRAQLGGWKTAHFPELPFRHLKNEGTGIGLVGTNVMLGKIYYRTGGGKVFLFMKVMHRVVAGRPIVVGACAMLYGYLKAWVRREPLLVSDAEARFYQRLLNSRMRNQLFGAVGRVEKA